MAGFTSFEPLLRKVMATYKPHKILEFGPGRSTEIMLEYLDVHVISIEHDWRYYEEKRSQIKNATIHYAPQLPLYLAIASTFAPYDFVFVDGFCDWRVACLKSAVAMLTHDGLVMLHDSERSKYDEGRSYYDTVEESDGTALLKPKDIRESCLVTKPN